MFCEVNFDGLIGPSHNYSGMAFGNLASHKNARAVSNPRAAALQGLEKMRTLVRLGYKQGFLPPQQRPHLPLLRQLGFSGTDAQLLNEVAKTAPGLLSMIYSASPMWAANAATVTPSPDSADGRLHFTPANLQTTQHRAIESTATAKILRTLFANEQYFKVHDPLPPQAAFADEGAANHTRLCRAYGDSGTHIYTWGRSQWQAHTAPEKFPARQTLEACQALARQHGVSVNQQIFQQQNPAAIDAGAFHNDVVAVGNGPLLFHHELAFATDAVDHWLPALKEKQQQKDKKQLPFQQLVVNSADVTIEDVIGSYLFNSQLLAQPDGDMTAMRLIAPGECAENEHVSRYLQNLVDDHRQPIREVCYVDVRQSMSNGGGPACLRLRVVMSDAELAAMAPQFLLDEPAIDRLQDWVKQYYRDRVEPDDLRDPQFMQECFAALQALTDLLGLGDFYPFQKSM